MYSLACFVSPHGYGHATRCSALLEALYDHIEFTPHLFTTVDKSLFDQNLRHYTYTELLSDIGFCQSDAFTIDLPQTIEKLDSNLPFPESLIDDLALKCKNIDMIICDISCLGIAVGKKTGVPSVLVENFTWDWLYSPHETNHPKLAEHSLFLRSLYRRADYHIQTEPLCNTMDADLHCAPIFRSPRLSGETVRHMLDHAGRPIVLITMGGIGFTPTFVTYLKACADYFFVVTGAENTEKLAENVLQIAKDSTLYHPDLIEAADVVVCKAGYSTIAECYNSAKPLICIQRQNFRESPVIEKFVRNTMNGLVLSEQALKKGAWLEKIQGLVGKKTVKTRENGAMQAARFIATLLKKIEHE